MNYIHNPSKELKIFILKLANSYIDYLTKLKSDIENDSNWFFWSLKIKWTKWEKNYLKITQGSSYIGENFPALRMIEYRVMAERIEKLSVSNK